MKARLVRRNEAKDRKKEKKERRSYRKLRGKECAEAFKP